MKRTCVCAIVGMLLLSALAAFPALAAPKTIGVTLLTREHQFYRDLEAALVSEAQKFGYKVTVTAGEFDAGRQAAQIDDFISRKVDALVVAPCDSLAVGSSIAAANKAGIPVFTVDIANLSIQGKVVAHVASDNTEGGRQAGMLMAKALNGRGKVVILNLPRLKSRDSCFIDRCHCWSCTVSAGVTSGSSCRTD